MQHSFNIALYSGKNFIFDLTLCSFMTIVAMCLGFNFVLFFKNYDMETNTTCF